MKQIIIILALYTTSLLGYAQNKQAIKVSNAVTNEPIEYVNILINNKNVKNTDNKGVSVLLLPIGKTHLQFTSVGYQSIDTSVVVPTNDTLFIFLADLQNKLSEVTIVSSTRNNQRIENSPIKVEVLGREEMDEESAIKPAGIASILGDVSGVQIQQSSVVNGNSNVRIQGLDGRYTQILKDGMPLYDGFSGSFGILSIPPLDLKQVELIKGSASTLYGGGAIGGLINIISRRPTIKQEAVLSINQTTLKETNVNSYLSKKYNKLGYTFFFGYNSQKAVDVDKDGFSDVSDLNGMVLHPRFFFYPDKKTTIIVGYTGTFEKRNGGDMEVLRGKADALHQYIEKNTIKRNSWELTAQRNLSKNKKIEFKSSLSIFNRKINNNNINFSGKQLNYYSELSMLIPYNKSSLVTGINVTGDQFNKITQNIPLDNFDNNTIGAFIQNTWSVKDKTTIEVGLRNDYHLRHGNFLLPRIAVFHRMNQHWATRLGVGLGYKVPNALAPQNTDLTIQNLSTLPSNIKAEKSSGYNAELNYKIQWGGDNELFINQAFFLTQLNNPIIAAVDNNGKINFQNQSRPIITKGFDTYIRAVIDEWELYAGYTYTIAERKYLNQNQFIPLTPKNRFAFTLVKEIEESGFRLGVEGSYNGYQYREDYSKTPGYFFMAAMIEKRLRKHISIVLNVENLFDYRQSRVELLYSGTISNPVFKPLWAPVDGRVLNMSIRWKL